MQHSPSKATRASSRGDASDAATLTPVARATSRSVVPPLLLPPNADDLQRKGCVPRGRRFSGMQCEAWRAHAHRKCARCWWSSALNCVPVNSMAEPMSASEQNRDYYVHGLTGAERLCAAFVICGAQAGSTQ